MEFVKERGGALCFKRRKEILEISAYGKNGLRVRATQNVKFGEKNWALTDEAMRGDISIENNSAFISNGKIRAKITDFGKITFYNDKGDILLKEYYRSWDFGVDFKNDLDQIVMSRHAARKYIPVGGNLYKTTVSFEANDEKLFGMGQYQNGLLNLKGSSLELAQKNTQISVPFLISSRGYGFMWNNPSVGTATFASNITKWEADGCYQIDYWITAGDSPSEIEENYADLLGKVPMMPDYAMGFWQCKLRYRTEDEVLSVAREYYERKIPVSVMVVDFFHWTNQGDWRYDLRYFPEPKRMADELNKMGMKLMVSVWPTVDRNSVHFFEMNDKDYLVRVDKGIAVTMDCFGFEQFIDVTNPEAREYLYGICKENYVKNGVELFWLDEAEPEYTNQDFDLYRYYDGPAAECANEYPALYSKAFYDGMKADGKENPINLVRCAWLSSQKYGALVWSGDVPSTFTYLKYQYTAGLNMGLAGIPWWTADIGGFHGGNIYDKDFQELLVRWFEFGCFLPVMRLHGDREPHDNTPLGRDGGGMCGTGAGNEVWSYPKEVEDILVKYIGVRTLLKPYISSAMREAHEKGTPVIKPLFYDYPSDSAAWEDNEEYLFGHNILVAPVMHRGVRERRVYLPLGVDWVESISGKTYPGGQYVNADADLNRIPVFFKKGCCAELIGKF